MTLDDRTTRVIRGWLDEAQNMPATIVMTPDRLAADLARAWDEGYHASIQDIIAEPGSTAVNPYRRDEL